MKRESRSVHNPVHASSDGSLQKAGRLSPPEERVDSAGQGNSSKAGLVDINTSELKFPKDLSEEGEKKPSLLGLEPVALVILILALAFIVYIAYLISVEPVQLKGDQQKSTEESR